MFPATGQNRCHINNYLCAARHSVPIHRDTPAAIGTHCAALFTVCSWLPGSFAFREERRKSHIHRNGTQVALRGARTETGPLQSKSYHTRHLLRVSPRDPPREGAGGHRPEGVFGVTPARRMQCDPMAPTGPEDPVTRDPEGSRWPLLRLTHCKSFARERLPRGEPLAAAAARPPSPKAGARRALCE